MKEIMIGKDVLKAPEIILGCMRISDMEKKEAEALIRTAMDEGINMFDHADIYGGGHCEEVFAQAVGMNSSIREKMILQSKCGIRSGFYDFSKEYILKSVDGILSRLKTDYLDVLLLHRPDTLMEPEEVAEAFQQLADSGKVKYFGVSNQNSMQIELLQKAVKQRLIINQLQLSLTNCELIDEGIHVNTQMEHGVMRDGSVLEYCRLKDITIQAWSPFQFGFFEGVFLNHPDYPELNRKIDEIAQRKGVTNSAVAVAWILRHPAKIQTIVGTTNRKRLLEICKASQVELTRKEWYELYQAAGKKLP